MASVVVIRFVPLLHNTAKANGNVLKAVTLSIFIIMVTNFLMNLLACSSFIAAPTYFARFHVKRGGNHFHR